MGIFCYNIIMAVTPQTDVYLLKCPLELDNNHQLNFANKTAQANYFLSLPKLEALDITYQRENNVIRFPAHIDSLLEYNYVMYKNENYSDKWFYAFITDMQYDNDYCTMISISTDYWQTWGFDIQFKQSMVEREHVADDTIGANTVPENIELGEYVCSGKTEVTIARTRNNEDNPTAVICMQVTTPDVSPDGQSGVNVLPSATVPVYNGIPQGCYFIAMPCTPNGVALLHTTIGLYDGVGKADAILSIFLCPRACASWTPMNGTGTLASTFWLIPNTSYEASSGNIATIPRANNLNGYTPRNNKLFTYPYNYLYVTNNNGTDIEFHYEDYANNLPEFSYYASLEQGGAFLIAPKNSKKNNPSNSGPAFNEAIQLGKLPQLSWNSDYYLNWKAQNARNLEVQSYTASMNFGYSTARSIMFGEEPSYGAGSLARDIADMYLQMHNAHMIPPQAKGNLNAGDIMYASGKTGYDFRNMTLRYEWAKRIDDYFDVLGYRVNEKKVPNFTSRRNWNFVKTADLNIVGDVPNEAIEAIKALFNNGITMWHNPATFLDYSQNNNIV